MTDYPTWARGGMMVDWEHRIDMDKMRKERVAKTQAAMKEAGIDALILWKDENVRYLTSARVIMIQYRSSTTYGVLLHQEGNPTLLASSGEAHRMTCAGRQVVVTRASRRARPAGVLKYRTIA